MAKFRTHGSCPAPQPGMRSHGCGFVFEKIWDTNTPEKVLDHVETRCPRCQTIFIAKIEPVEASTVVTKVNKEVVETITKPLSLVIEYTQTTTHYTGDNLPSIVVKPTGRVRRTGQADGRRENWFELPKKTIEEIQ